MSLEINIHDLIDYLARQPDVAAAYLFGSYARGQATSYSDIDIAVLFRLLEENSFARFERRLDLEIALQETVGRPRAGD